MYLVMCPGWKGVATSRYVFYRWKVITITRGKWGLKLNLRSELRLQEELVRFILLLALFFAVTLT